MKPAIKRLLYLILLLPVVAGVGVAGLTGSASAKDFYKMSTVNLPTPFALNTTFAKIIQKYNPDIEIQVNATGIAPRHAMDAAQGKIDFFFTAPSLFHLMSNGKAMFKKVKNAKEMSQNLRTIFNYRIGFYQFATYADSGINSLADIKGKRVFLGPPAAVARIVAGGFIQAITGLEPGKDYEVVKLGFGPAAQAFQDRQIDLLTSPSNPPTAALAQIALSNKLRFLGAVDSDWEKPAMKKVMSIPGRTRGQFPADVYGGNQVNTKPIQTVAAWVSLGTRKDIPEEVVYKMTKTFWEHVDEMYAVASWAKDAINLNNAFVSLNMKLHPGAIKYYKEKGIEIPEVGLP